VIYIYGLCLKPVISKIFYSILCINVSIMYASGHSWSECMGGMRSKMGKAKIWAWLMPSGKIYKVVTNPEKGTIRVYNPEGELVKRDEGLSNAAVSLIEKNFLEVVATKVKEEGAVTVKEREAGNELTDEIGMYIR